MKNADKTSRVLRGIHHYLIYFALVAFVVTCCMLLFLNTLSQNLGIAFTEENLQAAAKVTFANVVLLSLLFTVIDFVRRKLTVERPVKEVQKVLEQLKSGNFNARIDLAALHDLQNQFGVIAEDINALAEELSGVETLRTDFIANVSHELKTPLSVMQNYGIMLCQPELSEEKRLEYAGAVIDASRRLADLITNILKLSKLENQQIYPKAEEYDLSEQLCQCLLQFETVWEQKNLQIETALDDGVTVCADAELLCLVWNNLLSNAFKFTPEGGTVSVSLRADDTYVTVSVSDTGCGMSPEVGAHIFEKFYQGDTSHAAQGNGLGLALVKRVVDILHGNLGVESAPGKGSTFTVTLRRFPCA
ncbi:MAG: HAMP domain-containing sensor histidine kinase [Firmicutes bacterium]|nr:HAMP domain-containing sensor histidine kinase [Bacillota bacterium]